MGFSTDKCLVICLGQLNNSKQDARRAVPGSDTGVTGESARKCQPMHHWRKDKPRQWASPGRGSEIKGKTPDFPLPGCGASIPERGGCGLIEPESPERAQDTEASSKTKQS